MRWVGAVNHNTNLTSVNPLNGCSFWTALPCPASLALNPGKGTTRTTEDSRLRRLNQAPASAHLGHAYLPGVNYLGARLPNCRGAPI